MYTKNDSSDIHKVQYVSAKECLFQECKYDSRLENTVTYYIKIGKKSHLVKTSKDKSQIHCKISLNIHNLGHLMYIYSFILKAHQENK